MDNSPTSNEVRDVARKAVATFAANGLRCCLFGSAACQLYGNSRKPNDVDVVVMTQLHSTEYLKQLLATKASRTFYLRPAKTAGATYKVLFAHLKSRGSFRRSCKVDVLIPGVLNIPFVDDHRIVHINNFPVMPLAALLLLKLQGWSDHRASARTDMQQKQYVDVRDVNQLLQIAVDKGVDIRTETWLPQSFVEAGQEMLSRYLNALRPRSAHQWKSIGFDVPDSLVS